MDVILVIRLQDNGLIWAYYLSYMFYTNTKMVQPDLSTLGNVQKWCFCSPALHIRVYCGNNYLIIIIGRVRPPHARRTIWWPEMPFWKKIPTVAQMVPLLLGLCHAIERSYILIIFDQANPELNNPHTEQASKMGKNYE